MGSSTEEFGAQLPAEERDVLFLATSRPTLGLTRSLLQLIPEALSSGVQAAGA
jgi:hypothetical protein